PLIWGWLTYRVICFDALADHASKEERREILRRHRAWLLGMGLLSGYLGAAPSLLWASSALFAVAFVILAPLAIWIYTLVFAFSSLWFTHYCLYALEQLRREAGGEVVDVQASYSATAAPSVQPPAASLPPYPPGLPDESKSHGFPPA
ncbi:MAG: EI24 domain-containing protein, partial [Desulfobacterales bacterium]|nr:EI24 domain-containing protein [Desulfobacterales bacterium]